MTRFEDIKAFAFDVDGVFTDGLVLAMPDGDLLRQFNSKDCFAVRTAVDNGFPCAFITGGVSQSLLHRARSLGITDKYLYMLCKDKAEDFRHFCKAVGLEPSQVAYVGDDIPDIPAIEAAGLGVCPADAVAEVRALIAKYDLTEKDVFPAGRRGARGRRASAGKVPPKYRDPVTGQTWTGRGKAPRWIDGKDRTQFLIR